MMAIVRWQWYDGNACGRDEQSACPAPPASFSAAPPICQLGAVGKAATIAPGLTFSHHCQDFPPAQAFGRGVPADDRGRAAISSLLESPPSFYSLSQVNGMSLELNKASSVLGRPASFQSSLAQCTLLIKTTIIAFLYCRRGGLIPPQKN